jgi:glyoxylate/hydroxypyruvate reductase A
MRKKILVMLKSNPEQWAQGLQAALPDHDVLLSPDGEIDYAVVAKPAPGVLASIRGLKAVFSVNAGVEALLPSGVVPEGMPIVRMVDHGLAEGMLEWVLAAALAWHRNLFDYRALQLSLTWAPMQEVLARDRRVCVLGAGELGGRVAAALAQIGFNTRTWSRTPKQIAGVVSLFGADRLEDAVADCEILINLLPLTPATENLLDSRLFSRLKKQAVLINVGRGRHVVDEAVIDALDSGQLRAAVLDVFRDEPLPLSHPFWRHPGVYLTPHVAAPTHAASALAAIAENIRAFEAGGALRHVVDLARGY